MPYVEAAVRRQQFVAAARSALAAHGVANTSVRTVAAEAGVPLATMQYVFPSKAELLRAVIEDVVEEISQVLADVAQTERGLEHAIRAGLRTYWERLVETGRELQMLQYELVLYALRTPDAEDLARLQYERYSAVVAAWCRRAAADADEPLRIDIDRLARMIVAGVDGLTLQHLCSPDEERSRRALDLLADTLVELTRVSS